jgi:multicomponent Na+:H+ antiporter subunit E
MSKPLWNIRYVGKARQVIGLFFFFLWELIKSNVRVAYDVLTPGFRMRPAIIAIPLEAHTDFEITLLANLITLTPGTLSLDISSDRRTLYIHAMYVDDVEQVRKEIKEGFERHLLEVMR